MKKAILLVTLLAVSGITSAEQLDSISLVEKQTCKTGMCPMQGKIEAFIRTRPGMLVMNCAYTDMQKMFPGMKKYQ